MSDAEIDEQDMSSPASGQGSGKGSAADRDGDRQGPSPYRKPALAVVRVIVVLAIAAVGYQEVVPVHHGVVTKVVRTRLADLVIKESGVAGFKTKATSAAEQSTANVGIATLTTAAKESPDQTGLYSIDWEGSAKGSHDGVGVIVFLLPTAADAQSVFTQVKKTELGPSAQSADALARTATFSVAGVAGGSGSIYEPKKKTKTAQNLAVTIFRQGDVVGFVQEAKYAPTAAATAVMRSELEAVTKAESEHLTSVEPHFTLVEVATPAHTTRPTEASVLWIGGAVILAALAAFGPELVGRARRRRRERIQEELARLIVVRGQTITKRRR